MLGRHEQEDKINRYIREKVKEAREQRNMPQEELAKHLYKSRVAISDLERGRVQVSAADLVFIASALEKPISYFYPPNVLGAQPQDLSPKEKELVHFFRQLGHEALENVSLNQVRMMAESAIETQFKANWEEVKKGAEERGIELP